MNSMQTSRVASVKTPLGADALLFHSMTAREELGRPFEITLELLSDDEMISLADALGQQFTVSVELPEGGHRYFNGYVSQFTHVGRHGQFARYRATLVPWLWFLTRTSDCRIFQQKNVPDIIKGIFREHGFSDFDDLLSGSYREWEYCVQYRETDFNFVSRLMEQEGIYYYFKHQDGKHALVLADGYGSHDTVADYGEVPYYPHDVHGRRERDHIFEWSVSQHVKPGAYQLTDYDFTKPKADLLVKSVVKRNHAKSDLELFDYPGDYIQSADGDTYVRTRIEEQQAGYEVVQGTATARGLATGSLFSLSGYPRDDQNREYLISSTTLQCQTTEFETGETSGASFDCTLQAIDSRQPFRASRRTAKPVVQGPQTAIVVGKKGEEIWTDKYGRVKVQFHWDRYGKHDENSSCWVRVAQVWAGKTWGAVHTPRIGQEVIVEFLEGDPDRPIVTGRVYNGDEMPPYELPANQTQSGIKSRSTKDATNQNFNELRFEDKKDSEQIYFHAEKDFERVVENDDTLKVGFEKKDAGDQKIDIHNNQVVTIGNSNAKDGSQKITIWKDLTETIKTGNETVKIEKGKRTTTIHGDDALTIKTGNQSIKISAGKNVTEAAQSILIKCGASSIKIDPSSITLKSVQIKILGDATVDLKAPMTTCKGTAMLTLKGGMTMIN
jgi:type VI secretion system secreted protein VgrG